MHIALQVEGIRDNLDAIDALVAGFPAGTVSGAPKIRAMELIDDLEPDRRGVYAGAVGYISVAGDLDTCIALRTAIVVTRLCMFRQVLELSMTVIQKLNMKKPKIKRRR